MELTKLTTVDEVAKAMEPLFRVTAAHLQAMKPAQRRERAARLADLYEIRAQLFEEVDLSTVPSYLMTTLAMATARAAQADRDSCRFWRDLAGAR